MLKKEDRREPYPSYEFVCHLFGKRGKEYFPHCENWKERYSECKQAILDQNRGVIIPDGRLDKRSTHMCLFKNRCGENIALALGISEEGKITICTIKNIAESKQKPDWFYDEYEKIAKTRKMPTMERRWLPNEKY